MIDISGDASNLTTKGSTKVTYKNFIQVSRGGKVVHSLDAEFDFKEVPQNLHGFLLQILQMRGANVCMPYEWPPKPAVVEPEPPKQSFWRKLFGMKK